MTEERMSPDLEEALRTPDVMPAWVRYMSAAEWTAMSDALRIATIKFTCPTPQPGELAEEAARAARWREESKARNRAMGRAHIFHFGGPTGGRCIPCG